MRARSHPSGHAQVALSCPADLVKLELLLSDEAAALQVGAGAMACLEGQQAADKGCLSREWTLLW